MVLTNKNKVCTIYLDRYERFLSFARLSDDLFNIFSER